MYTWVYPTLFSSVGYAKTRQVIFCAAPSGSRPQHCQDLIHYLGI